MITYFPFIDLERTKFSLYNYISCVSLKLNRMSVNIHNVSNDVE